MIGLLYYNILSLIQMGHGPKGAAVTSLICTAIMIIALLLIGAIMNGIQRLQINLLEKIFGLKAALFISNYVTIAGTIIHESAHALFGILTGAKITAISFLDTKGDSLGHVDYIVRGPAPFRAIQHTMIACAPVFAGMIAQYFLINAIFYGHYSIWAEIFFWYLMISVINHMSMSSVDIKHYFQGMWAVAPLVFAGFFLYGFI